MLRTPDGETNMPAFRSSLLVRACPCAGCSIAWLKTAD